MGRGYWITWILISVAATFFMLPVGLIVMLITLVIIPQIYQHFDEKEYSKQIIHEVEQEVDEIEAELDTVFNNDKVTPIWEIPTKKK